MKILWLSLTLITLFYSSFLLGEEGVPIPAAKMVHKDSPSQTQTNIIYYTRTTSENITSTQNIIKKGTSFSQMAKNIGKKPPKKNTLKKSDDGTSFSNFANKLKKQNSPTPVK